MESDAGFNLREAKEMMLVALVDVREAIRHAGHINEEEYPSVRVVNHALSGVDDAVKVAIREMEDFRETNHVEV